jgi:hypothetical protein
VVNITSTGWLDEVSWTLSDASNTVILSGGPYPNTGGGGNFNATVNSTNGPFSFFIETQGQFNDNTPSYTISTGAGFVLGSGSRPGGSTFTLSNLNCSFANNNTDCDDADAGVNPGVPGTCGGCIEGCTDVNACNYDPAAQCDNGSCLFNDACGNCGGSSTAGCTDVNACNYDATAGCDNGSCEYASCAPCMGDFNGDEVRNVSDLLIMIAEFGCVTDCATDMNGDGISNGTDVLMFLGLYAVPCN